MEQLKRFRHILRNLVRRGEADRELDAELQAYADGLVEEKRRAGMTEQEAQRQARLEMGGIEPVKEQIREARRAAWMDTFWQDLQYSVRTLRRNPGFVVISVLTLALGIGTNAALFSVVNALLLRSLPYRDAERLVYVQEFWPHEPIVPGPPSPDFANWRARAKGLDGLAAYGGGGTFNLTGGGEPERIQGTMVTSGLLDLIGTRLALGRNFTAEEDRLGGPAAAILGHKLWQRRFAGSADVVGKGIALDGRRYTVVGVLPDSFLFPDNNFRDDLLVPMALPANPNWHDPEHFRLLRVLARKKASVTEATLRTELATLLRSTADEEPPQFVTMRRDLEVRVIPLRDWLAGDIRRLILVMQGAVAMVLLIGCLNLANLQVGRALARRREMAVRAALGAGRARLTRQLLAENMLLSGSGALCGLVVAYAALSYLRAMLPTNLHLAGTVRMDPTVLIFTLGLAVVATVLTASAPVVAMIRTQPGETLKNEGVRTTYGTATRRLHGTLIVAEIAIAMVLLAGAGLLIRSFLRLASVEPGFDPNGVLTLRISLPGQAYNGASQTRNFFAQLLERAQALPGVEQAAIASGLPLSGTRGRVGTWPEGRPAPPPGGRPAIPLVSASANYFRTLRIPLRSGREFIDADREGSQPVVIVNQALADDFFPGQNAIGKHLQVGDTNREIVGIVTNVRQQSLRDTPTPTLYLPHRQTPEPEMLLILRSAAPFAGLAQSATNAVHAIDAKQPVYDLATMEARIDEALSPQRANTMVLSVFAAMALCLAAIGIFGVLSYFVGQRSREIGIRIALGAGTSSVLRMVLGRGLALTGTGIAVGIAGALLATRVLQTLLFETTPSDPFTLSAMALLFASVAGVACYVPALRATRVDPLTILRHD